MDMLADTPICQIVVEAHDMCLEAAVHALNIRGAPSSIAFLGTALENLANTLRKLDFALKRIEEPNLNLKHQDATKTLLVALRGSAKVHKATSRFLSGHSSQTSTPSLRTFHEDEDENSWDEDYVLGLLQQIECYKARIDKVVLLAL